MDEHAMKFIKMYSAESDRLSHESLIPIIATDPMMPLTTLTEGEKLRVDEILNHLSDNYWGAFTSDSVVDLTRQQFNVARWAGEEWLESREFVYRYSKGLRFQFNELSGVVELSQAQDQLEVFTIEEQALIDSRSRHLIEQFSDLTKVSSKEPFNAVAIIEFMPLT